MPLHLFDFDGKFTNTGTWADDERVRISAIGYKKNEPLTTWHNQVFSTNITGFRIAPIFSIRIELVLLQVYEIRFGIHEKLNMLIPLDRNLNHHKSISYTMVQSKSVLLNSGLILLTISLMALFYAVPSDAQEIKEGELEIKELAIGTSDIGHESGVNFYAVLEPVDDSKYISEPFSAKIIKPDGSEYTFSSPIPDQEIQFYQTLTTRDDIELQPGEYEISLATGVKGEEYAIMDSRSISVSESEAQTKLDQVPEESIEYEHENDALHVEWAEVDGAVSYQVVASVGSGPATQRFRAMTTDSETIVEDVPSNFRTIQVHAYTVPVNPDYQGERFEQPAIIELDGTTVFHRSRQQVRIR